ncbi:hypothetical protein Cch01nite_18000 [Cellulomonas chitinilytica]|uniref:Mucin-associated surface protein n=1 Tax=Cellulomonas chitinilytica TaxID=398759 RepID=A0A919P3S5_9CELL|nr:hypothetical protein [Cellulomonas chitinilytica]GIG21076.1 hypothetical protein Cch01nite_18000 [Cellulomonas chitinilytica]
MTGRARAVAVVVLAVALVTAGCAERPDLADERAASLQAAVLDVTSAAAAGRWDDAEAALVDTRGRLDDGVDAGEVSTSRYREVDRALDRVAGALAAARAQAVAAEAAAQQAAAVQAATEQAAAQAAADQAAADRAAAATPARPADPQPAPAPKDKKGPSGPKGPGRGKG